MPQTQLTGRRQLEILLIQKAWRDPEFLRQIASDPKGMVEKQMGRKLPEEVRIFVHLEDTNTLHFSLPPRPAEAEVLSDEELERGSDPWRTLENFLSGLVGGVAVSITTNAW